MLTAGSIDDMAVDMHSFCSAALDFCAKWDNRNGLN